MVVTYSAGSGTSGQGYAGASGYNGPPYHGSGGGGAGATPSPHLNMMEELMVVME